MSHYSDRQYQPSTDFDTFYYHLIFRKGEKILDIACSTGNFLAQDPENITGIDIDKDAVAIAKKRGFTAVSHDATKPMPFKEGSIENAHCRHLLEHLDDPLSFMKDIHRVLKKGGRLALLTDKMSPKFWDDYTHRKPYTRISLTQLLHDAGFTRFVISDFPPEGIFCMGFLFRKRLISARTARKIYLGYAHLFRSRSLLLEAIKE